MRRAFKLSELSSLPFDVCRIALNRADTAASHVTDLRAKFSVTYARRGNERPETLTVCAHCATSARRAGATVRRIGGV